ncbi:MAG: DUF4331 family protein [Rhodomicrobium sp.]
MSNHFTGLSLGPPLGDQRLDLCDLYAFQSPIDPSRTVIILNANPNADALHPDAIYRLNIDNDGDYRRWLPAVRGAPASPQRVGVPAPARGHG